MTQVAHTRSGTHHSITRPGVDIVVPFVGSDDELVELLARLRAIRRGPSDSLTLVDNRARAVEQPVPAVEVMRAPERQSSYFARNRGASRGTAPWILFLDADVATDADLLDRYFEEPPGSSAGLLAGEVQPTFGQGAGHVARYGVLRGHLGREGVSTPGHEYAITANVAVRREAFEALGGFACVRSGGDADFSFRMRAAGWTLERRPAARVRHPTRASLGAMLRVFARYGAGAQWLRERYPTFAPPTSLARVVASVAASAVRVPLAAARGRHDDALVRALDPLVGLAFELGRFLPNERESGWRERMRHVRFAVRDRRRL